MATDKNTLKLEKRTVLGKKVKALRKAGILPGNIFGKGIKSLSVQLDLKTFNQVFKQAGETGIITATVTKEKTTRPLLISSIHIHPVTDEYLHVDFRQVDLTKKIIANIPVEVTGVSPATSEGGVLIQILNEIEVEALPADLPDKFILDISTLKKIGESITLKDIKTGSKVALTSEDLDSLVLKIDEPTKEKEVEVEEVEIEETEEGEESVEGEDKKEDKEIEGKSPAEGESKKGKDKKEDKPSKGK